MKLRTKLAIFAILLVLLVVAGSATAFYYSEKDRLVQESKDARQSLMRSLVLVSHDALIGNDPLPLVRYLKTLKLNHPEIIWAGVHHTGTIIAHTESSLIGKSPTDKITISALTSPDFLEQGYEMEGSIKILELALPINAGTARLGTARVGFSQIELERQLAETLRQTTKRILQVASLSALIGILGAIFLAQTVTRRIALLLRGVHTVASGNFRERINVMGSDEIQELAVEFNAMSSQLSQLYGTLKQQSEVLEKANKRLRELDALKNYFFSLASHELRGPLTSVKGYAALLLEGKGGELTEKQKNYLGIVKEDADRLTQLVNDFLDISRMETGTIKMQKGKMDVVELIESVYKRMRIQADNQNVLMEHQTEKNLPKILGDSERLGQVLTNLITNSLKFTPEKGKISISAKLSEGHILIVVQDTGRGIPSEKLGKIFEKYYQIEDSSQKKGMGLGLALAKEIVELHKGKIWAESEGFGKGSKFFIILPVMAGEKTS